MSCVELELMCTTTTATTKPRGDTILAVDGEPMHEADRIAAKSMDLFMGGHPASVLTLVVLRAGQPIDKVVHIR